LVLLTFILACNNNTGYVLDHDNEYGYELEITFTDTIAYNPPNQTVRKRKGSFFTYYRKNKTDTFLIEEGGELISSDITELKFDDKFIILTQKPLDSIWGPYEGRKRKKHFNNIHDKRECFENSKIHYEIVARKNCIIY